MLDNIDGAPGIKAVVIAPWIEDDVNDWIRTWNPSIIGQEETPSERLIQNEVFEEALKVITDRVKLTTGLSIRWTRN